jgi:hypothetical protein
VLFSEHEKHLFADDGDRAGPHVSRDLSGVHFEDQRADSIPDLLPAAVRDLHSQGNTLPHLVSVPEYLKPFSQEDILPGCQIQAQWFSLNSIEREQAETSAVL